MGEKYYDIAKESVAFSLMVIDFYKYLTEKKEYIMSKQLLRAGTSTGANIREAQHGQSKRDFLHKMNIALKEVNEVEYWLYLLKEGGYCDAYGNYDVVYAKSKEMIGVLVKIVKSTKQNLEA